MKVMPFLSVMKYGWHYFNAGMGTLRLLRSELFLYPLKGFRLKNACLCLRTHVHRYNEHRILPYKIHLIHTTAGCGLFPGSALNTPLSIKED